MRINYRGDYVCTTSYFTVAVLVWGVVVLMSCVKMWRIIEGYILTCGLLILANLDVKERIRRIGRGLTHVGVLGLKELGVEKYLVEWD